jgi:hypothetical protein
MNALSQVGRYSHYRAEHSASEGIRLIAKVLPWKLICGASLTRLAIAQGGGVSRIAPMMDETRGEGSLRSARLDTGAVLRTAKRAVMKVNTTVNLIRGIS